MVSFIVYNRYGRILRTGSAPREMVFLQVGKDKKNSVMEGVANDLTDRIDTRTKSIMRVK